MASSEFHMSAQSEHAGRRAHPRERAVAEQHPTVTSHRDLLRFHKAIAAHATQRNVQRIIAARFRIRVPPRRISCQLSCVWLCAVATLGGCRYRCSKSPRLCPTHSAWFPNCDTCIWEESSTCVNGMRLYPGLRRAVPSRGWLGTWSLSRAQRGFVP